MRNKKLGKGLFIGASLAVCLCMTPVGGFVGNDFCMTSYAAEAESITLKVKNGADITAALQDAVYSYKNIVIPEGSYTVTGIRANNISDVTINATGCTIKMKGNNPIITVQDANTTSNLTIIGGVWDANKSTSPAFRFNGTTSNLTLKDMTVKNSKSDGIRFKATKGLLIDSVTVDNNGGYGIILNDVKGSAEIKNCTISASGNIGFAAYNCEKVNISSTKSTGNKSDGVRFNKGTSVKLNKVTANSNGGYGIIASDISNTVTVTGCTAKENTTIGIAAYTCGTVTMASATASKNKTDGIRVNSTNNVMVDASTSTNNGGYGIVFNIINKSVTVSGCTATGNTGIGIGAYSCVDATVTASTSTDNKNDGVRFNKGTSAKADKVTANNNSGYGIIFNIVKSGVTITGCTTTGNTGIGMATYSCGNTTVTASTSTDNKNDGVRFNTTASVNADNITANNNVEYGIILNEVSGDSTIKNCIANENTDNGIALYKCGNVTMSSCSSANNGTDGVRFSTAALVKLDNITSDNNGGNGIIFDGVKKTITVDKCSANGNKDTGIAFYSCADVSLTSSTSTKNTNDGFRLNETKAATVASINAKSNGGYGIILNDLIYGAVLDKCKASKNGDTGLAMFDCKDITVKSATITVNGSKKKNSGHGIYVYDSTATLDKLTVTSNYWCGVSATGPKTKLTVNKGKFEGNGTRPMIDAEDDDVLSAGIGVYKKANAVIKEAVCNNNHGSGVTVASTKKDGLASVTVMGCTLTNNGDHGIGGHPYAEVNVKASKGGKRTVISGNKNNGILISEYSSSKYIMNADISNCGNMGVSLIMSSNAKLISDCTFTGNGKDGVRLADNSKVTKGISDCTFMSNGRSAIGVYEKSVINSVTSCKLNSSTACGIKISDAKINTINKVTANKNKESGISVDGGTVGKISNTTCNSNKKYGLCIASKSSVTVASLTANSNKVDGVRVTGKGTKANLTKVTAKSNKDNGVIVVSGGTVNKLNSCVLKSNGKYGLTVYNQCTLKTSSKNKISGNKNKQIYIQEKAKTKLKTKA